MVETRDESAHHPGHDEEEARHRLRERLESLLPDVIRRTVSTGVGAKQYTEDVIRGAIGDMKLPKEAVNTLLDLADNTKKEVVRVAAREFREFLESARFNEELAKILTQLSFEIRTEIRFVPNDQALRPSVSTSAKVRTAGGAAVDADPETTDTINEAVRGHAAELVEIMLGRILRTRPDGNETADAGADAQPEAEPAEGAKTAKPSPSKGRARSAKAPDDAEPATTGKSKSTRSSSTTKRKTSRKTTSTKSKSRSTK